jgi:hypothetical protein
MILPKSAFFLFAVADLLIWDMISAAVRADPPALVTLVPAELLYPNRPDGYRPLIPPRADFGPGFVFIGHMDGHALVREGVVCPNLYPQITPKDVAVVLNNYSISSKAGGDINISLLDRILRFLHLGTTSLDAKYGQGADYTVNLGSASESYIPLSDMWKGGKPIPVDPKCHAAIADLRLNNQFTDRVFVVSRSLTVKGLTYTFDKSSDASIRITTEIADVVKAGGQASVSMSSTGSNTVLDIKTPIHLGMVVEIIDRWVPSGAVSAQPEVTISGHPVTGPYLLEAKEEGP